MTFNEYLAAIWQFICDWTFGVLFSKTIIFNSASVAIDTSRAFIGEGAYSVVYKGTNRHDSSKIYAVKKMLIQSKDMDEMVTKEINAFRLFHHNNILDLYDMKETNESNIKVIYLLFPFIECGSLRDVLNEIALGKRKKAELIDVLVSFTDICRAVNVLNMHTPSYVHQDLKPENILITSQGMPLLTDFGSVRLADIHIYNRNQALNVADQAAQYCTAPYRAPELFDPPTNCTLDARTDVWALGCLLYAWWFRYSPFEVEYYGSSAKVVECNALRVLSAVPRSSRLSAEDTVVVELSEWILQRNFLQRPFTGDVIQRLDELVAVLKSKNKSEVV